MPPTPVDPTRPALRPIVDVAAHIGLDADDLELFGRHKAKVHLTPSSPAKAARARYVTVTAITPTPFGEGKTVVAIGLAQALEAAGERAIVCLRQPSLGPTFGIKGGAAGGGRATVEPRDDINLHCTGDTHAVGAAHNLLAAAIDAHLFHGNALQLDADAVTWRRVVDLSDRTLRRVTTVTGPAAHQRPRVTGFDITVASEVMAVLALARDRADLRARLERIVVGCTDHGRPVTAGDLHVTGAMAALLNDAVMPTLVQTATGTAAFVHTGPFANIAHGNSSIIADALALGRAATVITESGFGSDLGMEKFMHIKCRASGRAPDCVVLVATVRALKMHGGAGAAIAGRPLPPGLALENRDAVIAGCRNLARHVANARAFGVPVVVALNRFAGDTQGELDAACDCAREAGAAEACVTDVYEREDGGLALAAAVRRACAIPHHFAPLYTDGMSLRDKMERVATTIYGADGVTLDPAAERMLDRYEALGFATLPVCMAKTHLSLSHDPALRNDPRGFRVPVRDVALAAGAGFVIAHCGDVLTMPGLPSHPAYESIDVRDGVIVGMR